MKMIYLTVLIGATLIASCSNDDKDEKTAFDEFVENALNFSGDEAVDCGYITQQISSTHTTNCVINSFESNKPFYIFQEQSASSTYIVNATAMSPQGDLFVWTYNGDQLSGTVKVKECENPIIKSDLLVPTTVIFECSND